MNCGYPYKMKKVEVVSASIPPQEFYTRFVSSRTPALIEGHITDKEWQANKWTAQYLDQTAGDGIIQVERKKNGTFGNGIHESMTMHQFISLLKSGDDSCYLTTQELSYTIDDKPELVSEPVKRLLHDIPDRPALLGNLIPQNVNLWMGLTRGESTSGLHHDYHDNLYILLRGHKRIRLFPPQEIYNLYTYGIPEVIHPSGRVNYRGQLRTTADGASVYADTALQASLKLERVAAALDAEDGDNDGDDDDDDDDVIDEDELDAAMEELLDAEIAEEDCDEDDSEDDEDDSEEGDLDEYTLEDVLLGAAGRPLKTTNSSSYSSNNNNDTGDETEVKRQRVEAVPTSSNNNNSDQQPEDDPSTPPLNFSRVREGQLSESQLRQNFPLYVESRQRCAVEVTVAAGNMLFIPAGESTQYICIAFSFAYKFCILEYNRILVS